MSIVKRARKILRVTQGEFAKRFGVNRGTVARWERGEATGPIEVHCGAVIAWDEYQRAALEWASFPTASAQAKVDETRARFLAAMGLRHE